MEFGQAVKSGLNNYATFTGRASRSEFWWFTLFYLGAMMVAAMIWWRLGNVVWLALLVPYMAVAARRLHDVGKSGWFQLLWFIPVFGTILLVYWAVQKGDPVANEYGPPPVGDTTALLPPGAV